MEKGPHACARQAPRESLSTDEQRSLSGALGMVSWTRGTRMESTEVLWAEAEGTGWRGWRGRRTPGEGGSPLA